MTTRHPLWIIGSVLLATLAAGCGGGPADGDDGDEFEAALAYAQCMRDNGMPDFADPERNADGGFTMKKSMKRGQEEAMRKAEEACRDLDPANEDDEGGTVDTDRLVAWTTCMRAKVPNLPDPEVGGGSITIDLRGTGIEGGEGSSYLKAREACGDAGGNTRTLSGGAPSPGDAPSPGASD